MSGQAFLVAILTTAAIGLVGCGASGGAGAQPVSSITPGTPLIVAHDIAFGQSGLTVPANAAFDLAFDNEDGAPHNVTIFADDTSAKPVFTGEIFSGPTTRLYRVPPLSAGRHLFQCSVHPSMTGVLLAS